jgi:hypothetical protein
MRPANTKVLIKVPRNANDRMEPKFWRICVFQKNPNLKTIKKHTYLEKHPAFHVVPRSKNDRRQQIDEKRFLIKCDQRCKLIRRGHFVHDDTHNETQSNRNGTFVNKRDVVSVCCALVSDSGVFGLALALHLLTNDVRT